ncbi:MAG: 50S ribosomal protein L6 [Candidatus Aenigmatarchaeota archaeon]
METACCAEAEGVWVEKEIVIPNGVKVDVEGCEVIVSGPKGSLKRRFSNPIFDADISIAKLDEKIVVKGADLRRVKSFVGAIAAHISNMIAGVTKGYRYKLKIFHTHFPMTIEVKGNEIVIRNFLGEKSVRKAKVLGGVKVDVKKDEITVVGIDKDAVSQTAANIENACRIRARDRRVFLDGIYMTGWEFANA